MIGTLIVRVLCVKSLILKNKSTYDKNMSISQHAKTGLTLSPSHWQSHLQLHYGSRTCQKDGIPEMGPSELFPYNLKTQNMQQTTSSDNIF